MKAVVLDLNSLAPDDLDLSAWWALPLEWRSFLRTTAGESMARIAGCNIVLTNKTPIKEEHFAANPELKHIIVLATGVNNIDLDMAGRYGVTVSNIVDYSTHSVVQHTIAMILALHTSLLEYCNEVRAGAWAGSETFGLLTHPVTELYGRTLGIIGYGAIGQGVARVMESLGMRVMVAESLRHKPSAGRSPALQRWPLEQVYRQADVLSVHCPLSAQSRQLINAEVLAMMKADAILVNVSRGGIVDEAALLEALRTRSISAAALDVLEQEPPSADNPLLSAGLDNLLVTPHSAWSSQQARQNLVDQTSDILRGLLEGQGVKNQVWS